MIIKKTITMNDPTVIATANTTIDVDPRRDQTFRVPIAVDGFGHKPYRGQIDSPGFTCEACGLDEKFWSAVQECPAKATHMEYQDILITCRNNTGEAKSIELAITVRTSDRK